MSCTNVEMNKDLNINTDTKQLCEYQKTILLTPIKNINFLEINWNDIDLWISRVQYHTKQLCEYQKTILLTPIKNINFLEINWNDIDSWISRVQ